MKISCARSLVLIALVSFQANASSLVDGDAAAGKDKATTCAACHGAEGNSANPAWPNIAGQNAKYLVAQLKAFQPGEDGEPALRSDPLMTSMAAPLSDCQRPLIPSPMTPRSPEQKLCTGAATKKKEHPPALPATDRPGAVIRLQLIRH